MTISGGGNSNFSFGGGAYTFTGNPAVINDITFNGNWISGNLTLNTSTVNGVTIGGGAGNVTIETGVALNPNVTTSLTIIADNDLIFKGRLQQDGTGPITLQAGGNIIMEYQAGPVGASTTGGDLTVIGENNLFIGNNG